MDSSRKSLHLASKLDESWNRRKAAADAWNAQLEAGEIRPGATRLLWWKIRANGNKEHFESFETSWKQRSRRVPSVIWALSDVFGNDFWLGGKFNSFS